MKGILSTGLLSVLAATPVSAVVLWATAYNEHTVSTLNFDPATNSLTVVAKYTDCGSEPTWLTFDAKKSVLYCLNEGWGGNASITSFMTHRDGTLMALDTIPVLKSPVSSVLYGPDNSGLAVAH
jgi:6-phosphogluconolactonase (cycloisomerase 2 family)